MPVSPICTPPELVAAPGRRCPRSVERGPAVRPDGVLALGAAAGLLALTGVHRLEVVDVAVGLVEVAVAVVVVPVPDVELGQVVLDLLRRLAGRSIWESYQDVAAVLDEVPVAVGLGDGVAAVPAPRCRAR